MTLPYAPLISIIFGYLLFLFLVAYLAERSGWLERRRSLQAVVYVLTASVYCTAWTFYGSVGLAANKGLEFLTIYLGPALVAILWPFLLRKLVRVAKEQRITSISDFISSRYGKSGSLGTLVATLVVLGMIPYIALQLQAVSTSFKIVLGKDTLLESADPTLLVAAILGLFGILFGARNLDFTRAQRGLLSAVAVESVVKLLAFLAVGVYVTWGLFGGLGEIFGRVAADREFSKLVTLGTPPAASFARWTAMLIISMVAVMFLPRQFHVLVVQNQDERHIGLASWAFPLYLLLINLFVLPIAFAGLLLLPASQSQADNFILLLPLNYGSSFISILVFLGGFSAATAMIVVDSLALSKMLTNDIVLRILLKMRLTKDIYRPTLFSTRFSILIVVTLGYLWARLSGGQFLLVEMGLLSFVAVTQCAPAVLLGLYWRRGNRTGAFVGISLGFLTWFYTLIVPTFVKDGLLPQSIVRDGLFGIALLRPTEFLGLAGLDSISHGLFWSLLFNVGSYLLVSSLTHQSANERAQAAAFIGVFDEVTPTASQPAILSAPEIERLIHHYVGDHEARRILRDLFDGKAPESLSVPELLEFRIKIEKILAASLGAAAAHFIVEDRFTISKGEAQQLVESFHQIRNSLRTTEEEVRRGERLLSSVVQSVDDCILTTDMNGQLVTVNPAGERLFEAPANSLTGLSYREIIERTFWSRVGGELTRSIVSGRSWKGEVRGRTRTGRAFPAYLAVSCIFDNQGEIIGTVGVMRDLTEQVEMQQRLIQREKLASLGEMAAVVAHEIRNPLGGIKMATRILSTENGERPQLSQEMARSIFSAIQEIEAIVNDLLDYTRETKLVRQEFNLTRILEQVADTAAQEGAARGAEIRWVPMEAELFAEVDGQKIRQVFTNVVKNAIEATAGREGHITISCWGTDHHVVVEVRDNGVGMSAEEREKIFLPFFTTKLTGTGLGMAIVKKIVDLHGGEIVIDSAPGNGSRVRLTLPRGGVYEAAGARRRG